MMLVHTSRISKESLVLFRYTKKFTSEKWDISCSTTTEHCITYSMPWEIFPKQRPVIEPRNTAANTISAMRQTRSARWEGCVEYTVEYTTVILYSDWLYFLCHGIKTFI